MGFFDRNQNNNGYTDLRGMNMNGGYQQNPYQQGQYQQNPYQQDQYQQYPYQQGGYGQQAVYQQPMQNYAGSAMSLSDFTSKVYLQMFIGLAITFGIGLVTVLNPELAINIIADHIEVFLILCLVEVVLVFVLGLFISKMSSTAATVVFYAYSIINGITIAPALLLFDLSTVFWAIAVTAGIFGAMSFVGKVSNIDVSKWGSILMFGLIGLLLFSVIALIFRIPMSDLIICIIGIALFMGFTIYDTKKIKDYYNSSSYSEEGQKKTVIIAALQLYLDFINLFLYILRLFARNRN